MIGLTSESILAAAGRDSHSLSPDVIIRLIVSHSAREFVLDSAELFGCKRGSPNTALARQVAMYLAHVSFALDFATIGRIFGRDRTTAAHACRVVEYRRDDAAFDLRIAALEARCGAAAAGGAR